MISLDRPFVVVLMLLSISIGTTACNYLQPKRDTTESPSSAASPTGKVTLANLAGNYAWSVKGLSKEDFYIGDLTLQAPNSGRVTFSMQVASPSCVGILEGEATVVSDTLLRYLEYDDKEALVCELTFILDNQAVRVEEQQCVFYHGAQCEFTGQYEKQIGETR